MSSECKCTPLSSVGKKQIMGVTGLLLCGFLLSHLAGNFLLFVGADAFNKYSHALVSNPLIYVAEVILTLLFLSHIVMALKLTMENKKARPEQYYMRKVSGRGANIASSSMPYTGMIALVFLVIHITGIKYGPVYMTNIAGVPMRDIYKTTIEYFQSPLHVFGYLIAMLALGVHTAHGFWSAFQSLGFNHPTYTPKIRLASKAYGLLIFIGFSSLPVYCYFLGVK